MVSKRIVFFSKLLLVVANLCYLRYCANKFVCAVLKVILLDFAENRYTCTLFEDACLK